MMSSALISKSVYFTFSETSISTPENKQWQNDSKMQKVAAYYKGICQWNYSWHILNRDINLYPANVDKMASSYQCYQTGDGI